MTVLLKRSWSAEDLPADLITRIWNQARRGHYDGIAESNVMQAYLKACTWQHQPSGTCIIFTRDRGMHSSGWWKNPDYDSCRHLSLSYRDPLTWIPAPHDHALSRAWCEAIFGADRRLLWIEPPFSAEGQLRDVYHYRQFLDRNGDPIKPRGEVYSRHLTPAGWLSWSDLHGDEGDRRQRSDDGHNT